MAGRARTMTMTMTMTMTRSRGTHFLNPVFRTQFLDHANTTQLSDTVWVMACSGFNNETAVVRFPSFERRRRLLRGTPYDLPA